MTSIVEKMEIVARARVYCEEYAGENRLYFSKLIEKLDELEQLPGKFEDRIEIQYRVAIAAILRLVDRPSFSTLESVLARLNQKAESNFKDVQFVGGPFHAKKMSILLKPAAEKTAAQRALVKEFRNELSTKLPSKKLKR